MRPTRPRRDRGDCLHRHASRGIAPESQGPVLTQQGWSSRARPGAAPRQCGQSELLARVRTGKGPGQPLADRTPSRAGWARGAGGGNQAPNPTRRRETSQPDHPRSADRFSNPAGAQWPRWPPPHRREPPSGSGPEPGRKPARLAGDSDGRRAGRQHLAQMPSSATTALAQSDKNLIKLSIEADILLGGDDVLQGFHAM